MADSLFNLQVKRILARSTHHQLSMQIEAAPMPCAAFRISSQFYSISAPFFLCCFLFCTSSTPSCSFCCCGCNLNPQKWCQFLLALPFQNSKAQSEWSLDATLGQLKGEARGRVRYRYAGCGCAFNAQWQLLLSCCLPLGKNVWTTSEAEQEKNLRCFGPQRAYKSTGHSSRRGEAERKWGEACWACLHNGHTGTCSASFWWQFACTRQPSTANSFCLRPPHPPPSPLLLLALQHSLPLVFLSP